MFPRYINWSNKKIPKFLTNIAVFTQGIMHWLGELCENEKMAKTPMTEMGIPRQNELSLTA